MQIRNFWVDIENSSGTKIGKGPLRASGFRNSDHLSASGEFNFVVSAADPNISALAQKRVAICKYVDHAGDVQVFGGGVIEKIVRKVQPDGSMILVVSGNDLARELTYRSVGTLDLSGIGGAGVADAPDQVMAFAPAGWSISDGSTLSNFYAGFDGESVLWSLVRISARSGEHWRLGSGRNVEWIGPASTFEASGIRAIQQVNDPVKAETASGIALITSLEEESDAAELISRVIPRGSGNGGASLTLFAATDSPPIGYTLDTALNYVKRDDTEATYGRIERALDFKDIGPLSNTTPDVQAAANMLLQASVEHLRRYGEPQEFYRVGLANVGQILKPGTTIHLVYRGRVDDSVVYDLNNVFNIVEAEREITAEGIETISVVIATIDRLPMSDEEYLASQSMNARVLAAHQQLGASVDTFTYRDELDNAKGASFRFWLGDEYTSIQRAVMRFRIPPLRSTVKSVAGSSTTTNSGGGSTQTSSSGGGSSTTSGGGDHAHFVPVANGTTGQPVFYGSGSFRCSGGSGISPVPVTLDSPAHTHTVTISPHTHNVTIPPHSHDLTPNITMQYGIFEESGANTLALVNLVIKLNGGADLNSNVNDIGNGWYELDITADLVDAVFRPAQENNEITITTATAKTARIEAQVTIRGVVQAVAYS